MVRGDSRRLRQIVINLVGNAIKFANQGEVALKVESDAPEGEELLLRFTLADTGTGVARVQQEGIFVPDTKADACITVQFGEPVLVLTIQSRLVGSLAGR